MTRDEIARAVVRLPGFDVRGPMREAGGARFSHYLPGETAGLRTGVWRSEEGGYVFIRQDNLTGLDLGDDATGGCLLGMVPPEERHRVEWDAQHEQWAWLSRWETGVGIRQNRVDSLGHAVAAVLVDCGLCV